MANELTTKERAFAQLMIAGTKADAYRRVYSAKGKPATQAVAAYRLSKKPKIQKEVERLLQHRAFPADDYKRLQETSIAGLTEIFLHDPDPRVRLETGSILLNYADAGLKSHPEPSTKERAFDEITRYVEDAARKHREALGREPEQALIAELAEEEAAPLVEVAVEGGPPGGEGGEPEPDEPARIEASCAAEQPAAAFRWELVPGYFPPKRRRVPIEP
jgi:hypothetical protein